VDGVLVIFAERQSAGRGRFGRRWESASHRGLWFSILLRPELPLRGGPRLTTWAAVAVAAAVESTPSAVMRRSNGRTSPPRRRKSGRILIESAGFTGHPFAVVGIGVNVNQERAFSADLAERAGSFAHDHRPAVRPGRALAVEVLASSPHASIALASAFGDLWMKPPGAACSWDDGCNSGPAHSPRRRGGKAWTNTGSSSCAQATASSESFIAEKYRSRQSGASLTPRNKNGVERHTRAFSCVVQMQIQQRSFRINSCAGRAPNEQYSDALPRLYRLLPDNQQLDKQTLEGLAKSRKAHSCLRMMEPHPLAGAVLTLVWREVQARRFVAHD